MVIDIAPLATTATSIGFGGITGFLIGYAIKKVMKIMLIVLGLLIVAVIALEYQKLISVNWNNKIQTGLFGALGNVTNGQIPGTHEKIATTMSNIGIPLTGSLTAGFVLGFLRG
jgi:uncharacterized membrane protein (Fun14 family)